MKPPWWGPRQRQQLWWVGAETPAWISYIGPLSIFFINIYVHVFCLDICFHFSWVYIQQWNWWVIWLPYVNILRNCQTVLQWLHHFKFSLAMYEHSYFSISLLMLFIFQFLNYTHLMGVIWYLIVVLILIFKMTNDFEYLFMHLIVTCVSSLDKYLSSSLVHLKIGLLFFWWVISVIYIFWILNSMGYMIYKNFLPFSGSSFQFLDNVLWSIKVFNFDDIFFMLVLW